MHALQHYLDCIRRFGTTDGYNTEATERLHIDLAKVPYRETNRKEYLRQMVSWLDRQEKMAALTIRIQWQRGDMPQPRQRPRRFITPGVHLAKQPSERNVDFLQLSERHGATLFSKALSVFIAEWKAAHSGTSGSRHLKRKRHTNNLPTLPISEVDVWHRLKFGIPNLHALGDSAELHTAHAVPGRHSRAAETLDARFDTVLVNETETSSMAETHRTGIKGMCSNAYTCIRIYAGAVS